MADEKDETKNTDPPAKEDAGKVSAAGDQKLGKTDAGKSDEADDEGDWIDKSSLSDNQKKHVRKLMTQNKNKSAALEEAQQKVAQFEKEKADEQRKRDEEQGNWKKIAEENEAKIKAKDDLIMRERVRNLAIKEGIIDPDMIDILPLEGVSMNDKGQIVGADAFIAKYKKEKSYLFGEQKSKDPEGTTTTRTNPAPNSTASPKKSALDMTTEEFRKDLASISRNL